MRLSRYRVYCYCAVIGLGHGTQSPPIRFVPVFTRMMYPKNIDIIAPKQTGLISQLYIRSTYRP